MRKFRFKLGRLEAVKGIELSGLQQAVAIAEQAHRQALSELEEARVALESGYDELARRRSAGESGALLDSLESYGQLMREQIRLASERVIQREAELRAAREALTAKHQEKKALEKVRERQYQLYSLELERHNQSELDETAKNVHERNN